MKKQLRMQLLKLGWKPLQLNVCVREDITPSQSAVQAGHVVAQYMLDSNLEGWKNSTLVYLGVKSLKKLELIKLKLEFHGLTYSEFKEPDMDNETTAIACDVYCPIFERLDLL